MRICLVVPGFSADADDWCIPVIRSHVERLSQSIEVVVVTPHYPFTNSTYTIGDITVHCLSSRKRTGLPRLALWRRTVQRIVQEGRRKPFDAIHGFWATETGWLATVASARLRTRSIVSIAGGELAALRDFGYGTQLRFPGRELVRRTLDRADVLTAGSSWLINLIPERHRRRVHRIPLGVDTALFVPGGVRRGRRLLAVSSLYPWKDLPTTLTGVSRLLDEFPDVTLDVVGNGILRDRLESCATRLAIRDRVTFHGHIRYERMPEIYNNADRLVHAGRYESQGMAILEALATGLPVISSRVGLAADLNGELLTTFDPGNVDHLVRALRDSFNDVASAERTARDAPERIDSAYSLAHSVDALMRLYHSNA